MGGRSGVAQGLLRDARAEAIEADIRAELEAHIELCAEGLRVDGRTSDEAQHEARARFGNWNETLRACRRAKLGGILAMRRLEWILIVVLAASTLLMGMRAMTANAQANTERDRAMAEAQNAMAALLESREPVEHIVVGVDDVLQVQSDVIGQVGQRTQVQADGQALFKQVGWVRVAGRTREQVEEQLTELYQSFYVEAGPVYVIVTSAR